MKPILILIIGLAFIVISCDRSETTNEKAVEISIEQLSNHVAILASDSLEGRGAGYSGEMKAAEYIASNFERSGLEPINPSSDDSEKYFHPFEFKTFGSDSEFELKSQNVAGILVGGEKSDEYIVIGGHHDGQGMTGMVDLGRELSEGEADSSALSTDRIWNSAVDNAVSIAVIMEMARVMKASGNVPNRSIVFSTFSAEESGLDGSIHFANHPPAPKEKIKAMINLEKIVGDPEADFLYVSYSTSDIFPKIRDDLDSLWDIELVPFYPGMIANTDHYGFGLRGIPAITMGTGSQNNVHTPSDHSSGLDYELLKKRAEYIFEYLLKVANYDGAIEFTGELDELTGVTGGAPTNGELRNAGFSGENAFKVASVVRDSRGYNAGIRSGDLIISVNEEPIPKQTFYQGLEDVLTDSEGELRFEVIRNGKRIDLIMQ